MRHVGGLLLPASYHAAEQRLMRTAKTWTSLRMNYYAEAFIQEAQMSPVAGALTGLAENREAFVSRDDVALAAARLVAPDGHAGGAADLRSTVRRIDHAVGESMRYSSARRLMPAYIAPHATTSASA